MPSETPIDFNFEGVAPSGVINDAMRDKGYGFYMARGASDWFLTCRNRDGSTTALTDVVKSMDWDEDLEDIVISGTLTLDNSRDDSGKRVSQLVGKGSELILSVRNPVSGRIEEREQFVVWERRRRSDGTMTCTIYNHMKYLADSKVTVLYAKGKRKRHWNATEITKHLCREYGIRLARVPARSLKDIPYFYQEDQSLLDILIRLWTLEAKHSKRNFVLRMRGGRLHVITKPKNPQSKVLELSNEENDSGILSEIEMVDSIEGVKTVVRLWGTQKDFADGTPDTRRAVVKSKQYASAKGVATWGRIYHEQVVQGVITKAEINKRAVAELKKLARSTFEGSCTIIGYPSIRAGVAIRVHETVSGASGLFWFKSMSHSISEGGEFKSSGNLVRYEYTKKLATDPEDLKPDSVSTDTTGGGSVGPLGKKNAIPADIWNTLRAASAKAGVPQEWANSKALEKLLQHESSFKWTAKNPSSTAYGLFQFLDKTWANWDTGVTLEQASPGYAPSGKAMINIEGVGWIAKWKYNMCVAGLKYIKKKYGTCEKAWAYWKKNGSY